MAASPKIYTRLARPPLNLGTYKSLWLAADHFMLVESTGYNETYQRFQFADVQAFFVQPSNRRLYWNLFWTLWAIVAVIPFLLALTAGEMPGASLVFLIIAGVFLLWNSLLGPTCRVHLVTKVQTLHLGGLARLRKASRVLGRLQPLIEDAQKSLVVPVAKPTAAERPAVPTSIESGRAVAPAGEVQPSSETAAPPPAES